MKEKLVFYRPAVAAFLAIMAMAMTSSTISFFLSVKNYRSAGEAFP